MTIPKLKMLFLSKVLIHVKRTDMGKVSPKHILNAPKLLGIRYIFAVSPS